MIGLFKQNKFIEGRKIILANARPEEYPDIYRFFYQNLYLFGEKQFQQEDALLIIRDAVVRHNTVVDQEINLAACLVELTRVVIPNI